MAFVSEIVLQPAEEATEQPTATPTVVPVQTPEPTKFSENVLNQMICQKYVKTALTGQRHSGIVKEKETVDMVEHGSVLGRFLNGGEYEKDEVVACPYAVFCFTDRMPVRRQNRRGEKG